jgi:hypothetical protein
MVVTAPIEMGTYFDLLALNCLLSGTNTPFLFFFCLIHLFIFTCLFIYLFLFLEAESHHIVHAGLELLDLPASVSQVLG